MRGRSSRIGCGASSIWPLAVRRPSGTRGVERAEVDAVRLGDERVEGEPVGFRAEAVAVGTGAHHQVDQAGRARPRRQRVEQLLRVAAVHRAVLVGHGGRRPGSRP